jgi:uridine kinase
MEIRYKDKVLEVEKGSKIYDIFKNEIENSENTVVGAIYNNSYVNLSRHMNFEGRVELISINSKIGIKIYRRTLIYIFAMALKKLFPDNRATVNYQMENAVYCDLGDIEVTDEIVAKINEEMRDIVRKNLFIKKVVMNREQAEQFYKETQTARGKLQFSHINSSSILVKFLFSIFNHFLFNTQNLRHQQILLIMSLLELHLQELILYILTILTIFVLLHVLDDQLVSPLIKVLQSLLIHLIHKSMMY